MRTAKLSSRQFAAKEVEAITAKKKRLKTIALIIPAYNESLVLEHTIQSAINAGLDKRDIFVVDDSSSDGTSKVAKSLLGKHNVMRVHRSGKGLALDKIIKGLQITKRYRWIHIADADGEFDPRYFKELRSNLRIKNAAATGYVSSLPGRYISSYRSFEYTVGMDIIRRFQSIFGVITIIPGPTSIFRNDVFENLNFNDKALCEDFDVTLQIHRKGLGSIQFIPSAIARTQDPATFHDFVKQITRWNRGVMQMIFKHKIGSRASRIDTYLAYQIMQNLLFFAMYFIWIPTITILTHSFAYLALAFLADVILIFGFSLFAATRTQNFSVITAFPLVYALRWVSLLVFIKSFIEVTIFSKHRSDAGLWETVARRTQAKANA